jgi:hypothetical protein
VIRRRALAAVIVVGALAALGPVLPAYPLTLITQALIFGILAMRHISASPPMPWLSSPPSGRWASSAARRPASRWPR